MLVLTSAEQLADQEGNPDPVVVVAASDTELVDRAVRHLEADDLVGVHVWKRTAPVGRPAAEVLDEGGSGVLALSLALVVDRARLAAVRALCCERGLLIVVDRPGRLDASIAAIARADEPSAALAVLLAEVGRLSEEALETFAAQLQDEDDARSTFLSPQQREQALGMRKALLAVDNIFEAQHRLVDDDEDVVRARLSASRHLAVARHRFAFVSQLARRMYGATGDELSQQSSLITEQLTLVNTVFLPLTLGASFFGMNFGWMTDRIGSWQAFVLLGMGVPAVLSGATVLVARRLRRRTVGGRDASGA